MIREAVAFTPEVYQKIVARTNGATFSESVLALAQVGLEAMERGKKEKSKSPSFEEFVETVKNNVAKKMGIPRKLLDEQIDGRFF